MSYLLVKMKLSITLIVTLLGFSHLTTAGPTPALPPEIHLAELPDPIEDSLELPDPVPAFIFEDLNSVVIAPSSAPSIDPSENTPPPTPAHPEIQSSNEQTVSNPTLESGGYWTSTLQPTLKTIQSILDPRPFFCWPMTWQKTKYWALACCIVGACVAIEETVGLIQPIRKGLDAHSDAVMAVFLAYEPLMLFLALFTVNYEALHPDPSEPQIPSPGAENVAIVIAAHNSAQEIEPTIRAALAHVKPEQIFIIDNGNSQTPTDDTQNRAHALDPRIHYYWAPIGSKLLAQYAGTQKAAEHGYQSILTIDDDVQLPLNFHFASDILQTGVKGVAYPIRAVHPSEEKSSFLVRWQDLEYKLSDLVKQVESQYSIVPHPHGAISLWERETLEKILRKHSGVFCHDDVEIGKIALDLKAKLVLCGNCAVKTIAPDSVLGNPPNLYSQRVRVWDTGRHAFTLQFLYSLICQWDMQEWKNSPTEARMICGKILRTLRSNLILKGVTAYALFSIFSDIIRPVAIIYYGSNPIFWVKLAGYSVGMLVPLSIWNGVKLRNRPDLRCEWKDLLTYPAYQVLATTLSSIGAYRAWTLYLMNQKKAPSIPELERQQDPRLIWTVTP